MNKGFTLIELLGVLVILSILALITVPLIQGTIEGAGGDSEEVQKNAFKKAAENWVADHVFSLPEANDSNETYTIVTLKELINGGYLEPIKDSENYNLDKACVKISNTDTKYQYEFFEDCSTFE